jgi:DNA mismatch repair protein MutH
VGLPFQAAVWQHFGRAVNYVENGTQNPGMKPSAASNQKLVGKPSVASNQKLSWETLGRLQSKASWETFGRLQSIAGWVVVGMYQLIFGVMIGSRETADLSTCTLGNIQISGKCHHQIFNKIIHF